MLSTLRQGPVDVVEEPPLVKDSRLAHRSHLLPRRMARCPFQTSFLVWGDSLVPFSAGRQRVVSLICSVLLPWNLVPWPTLPGPAADAVALVQAWDKSFPRKALEAARIASHPVELSAPA